MYSLLSRETAYCFLKKDTKMGPLTMAAMTAGGAALGLGEEVLMGNYKRKKQLEQQLS